MNDVNLIQGDSLVTDLIAPGDGVIVSMPTGKVRTTPGSRWRAYTGSPAEVEDMMKARDFIGRMRRSRLGRLWLWIAGYE